MRHDIFRYFDKKDPASVETLLTHLIPRNVLINLTNPYGNNIHTVNKEQYCGDTTRLTAHI